MSTLLSASLHKSLADVTRRKGRTLMVVLGIFIGVLGLTGLTAYFGLLDVDVVTSTPKTSL